MRIRWTNCSLYISVQYVRAHYLFLYRSLQYIFHVDVVVCSGIGALHVLRRWEWMGKILYCRMTISECEFRLILSMVSTHDTNWFDRICNRSPVTSGRNPATSRNQHRRNNVWISFVQSYWRYALGANEIQNEIQREMKNHMHFDFNNIVIVVVHAQPRSSEKGQTEWKKKRDGQNQLSEIESVEWKWIYVSRRSTAHISLSV